MFSKLCLFFVSLTMTLSACYGSSLQEESGTLYGHIIGFDTYILNQDIVFTSQTATSKLECLYMCMQHCTCVAFTHTATSCSGSSSGVLAVSVQDPTATSYTVFKTPGLNTACTPGFYYSVSTNTCVKDCQACALQREVISHVGYGILGHVDKYETVPTETDCYEGLIDTVYLTATYNATAGTCHSHLLTYNDVPISEQISGNPVVTYYQKQCV